MIQPETLRRITAWLRQYVQGPAGSLLNEDLRVVRAGIDLLISKEVMTAEEIRREALKEFAVIIPAELLTEKATGRPLPDHITE